MPLDDREVQSSYPPTEEPVCFGYKTNWFAVKAGDGATIAALVGVGDAKPASWRDGLEQVYAEQDAVFVSPPHEGWIFVVGRDLPYPVDADRNDRTGDHLKKGAEFRRLFGVLADHFGDVQFFGTNHVSDFSAWAKAEDGKAVRVFCFEGSVGEVYANEGRQTAAEARLGLVDPGPRSPAEACDYLFELEGSERDLEGDAEVEPHALPGEEDVVNLAGLWSVNPLDLSEPTGVGVLGIVEPR